MIVVGVGQRTVERASVEKNSLFSLKECVVCAIIFSHKLAFNKGGNAQCVGGSMHHRLQCACGVVEMLEEQIVLKQIQLLTGIGR